MFGLVCSWDYLELKSLILRSEILALLFITSVTSYELLEFSGLSVFIYKM